MDLHLTGPEPTSEEIECVDKALGIFHPGAEDEGNGDASSEAHFAFGGHENRARRHLLLPVLHAIQSRFGWIVPGAIRYACRRLDLPPAEAYGVASFYGLFSMTPVPPAVVHVCDDLACLSRGSEKICARLERALGPPGSPGPDGASTWLRSSCLGLCELAPAAAKILAGPVPADLVLAPTDESGIFEALRTAPHRNSSKYSPRDSVPQAGREQLRLLRRLGKVDPGSLHDYRSHGGYRALGRALELGPGRVVEEVIRSKLVGRGGAAFPTGRKWETVARSLNRTRYLVCNADESEPGTFKDRIVMEGDPFALIESLTIAAFATGCERGYIYIRGEYRLASERLNHAIESARAAGLLGSNILGCGVGFDLEVRQGAGAYICGEETALFNSIEGCRGEPRNKPPYPTQAGLFGNPTVVNNVETLINVPDIVLYGGAAYAAIGTPHSTGTKLFCLSGHVARPGVYEVAFGATLGQVIALAGGVAGTGKLQAVLLGGAAGSFLTPAELDTPLTLEGTRAIGATLGSGVVMLFDDSVDLKTILIRIAAFFRDESCGQCVPCRVGVVRQEELLHRLVAGIPLGSVEEEKALLSEIGQVMRDASICGLGQTASSAVESAFARWPLFR